MLRITVAGFELAGRWEDERSPRTVAFVKTMLPYDSQLIQARWSGQAAWIPMGDYDVGDLGPEDPTSYPAPGQLLLYPGGVSEVEILFPYGDTCFASKAGQLAGNVFASVVEGNENLQEIGQTVLWQGAQAIRFEEA
jgi:hypothetical protein